MTKPSISEDYLSWGRVVRARHFVVRAREQESAEHALELARSENKSILGYGLGRSYGDSNLNPDGLLYDSSGLDHFISFDKTAGLMRAEAGASLGEILAVIVPNGFFLPTTPGSQFVTLAGAVANDVHGKNHHRAGSFGNAITKIGLVRSDLGEIEVSPEANEELFYATIGGMGLTGLISWVEFRLAPIASAFLEEETIVFKNLREFFEIEAAHKDRFEHTVSWIDCTTKGSRLGRGIFSGGNWLKDQNFEHRRPNGPTLPFNLPSFTLNPLSLKAFNSLYFHRQQLKSRLRRTHYQSFFYPLDAIQGWNKLYGAKGFYQYQSVIPTEGALEATEEMLNVIASSGQGSMLAVLKTFGSRESVGLTSFPTKGATLALDFKNSGEKTQKLMSRLDEIVLKYAGRLYPAKDGRVSADLFQSAYPEWAKLESLRDPVISSAFWRRVTRSEG